MLMAVLFTTVLGLPAFGQDVVPTSGGSCVNRFQDNLLTAWAQTVLQGSAPESTLASKITFVDEFLYTCVKGAKTGNACIDFQVLDGDKNATATGQTPGLMSGPLNFRADHYFEGGSPFHTRHFPITCPPPPDPQACTGCSPIIVPVRKGNHVKLSSLEQGVFFDIDGDGELELVAWPEEPWDVAFLAMDRDGDGLITSGKELFGDATDPDAPTGFHALALLPRVIEGPSSLKAGRDAGFDDLLLWFDRNRDGVSQPDELEPASAYLTEISLYSTRIGKRDQHGNLFYFQGWMRLKEKPDETRPVYDVIFLRQ